MCLHRRTDFGHLFSDPNLLEELASPPCVDEAQISAKPANIRIGMPAFSLENLALVFELVAAQVATQAAAYNKAVGIDMAFGCIDMCLGTLAWGRSWDEMGYRASRDGWKGEASTEAFQAARN
jgi:hypothetical protein